MAKQIFDEWICCYDIRDKKRLAKVHQTLNRLGIAINYSVFYLKITYVQFKALCKALQAIIRNEDDLRLYACTSLFTAKYIGEVCPEGIYLINAKGVLI